MRIMVMEEEFCRMWAEKYSEKLIQNVDDKLDDADDEERQAGRLWWNRRQRYDPVLQVAF